MKLTATSGTAAEAMAGVSGDIGAKTGSAEVDNQKKPNAWFSAYRDDVAAAAVVPASGHGGSNAGPVVRAILTMRLTRRGARRGASRGCLSGASRLIDRIPFAWPVQLSLACGP